MSVHFKKKSSDARGQDVPTASMPDIVFMLLIFFMVTTVLRNVELKVRINFTHAKNIEKIEQKRLISYIYVGPRKLGRNKYGKTEIQIDNDIVNLNDIEQIMADKLTDQPKLIVSLRIDEDTKTGILSDIQQQLRQANTLRINYSTKEKNPGQNSGGL